MWEGFQIFDDELPHITMAFLTDGRTVHAIFAENVGLDPITERHVIVQNERFAIHTTTS